MKITIDMVKRFMELQIPFNRYLGFHVVELGKGRAVIEVPFRSEFIGDPFRPALHGGVISALIDACGGTAVWTEVEPGDRVSTVDLRVDYLRPGPLETIVAEARVVRIGNRVGVTDMSVFGASDRGRAIAMGKGVYNIKRTSMPIQIIDEEPKPEPSGAGEATATDGDGQG